jgi:hypothetical protein
MALIMRRSILSVSVGAALLVGLCACVAPGAVHESPSPTPSVSSTPEDTESPDPAAFVLPTTCTDFLGAELENQLHAYGDVFLWGPGGSGSAPADQRNPDYLGYQNQGTPLFCIYGDSLNDIIEFDVQALSSDSYSATLKALTLSEYIESTDGDVKTFAMPGAYGLSGADLHALYPDGWITVHRDLGGTRSFAEMSQWLAIVTAQVYPTS